MCGHVGMAGNLAYKDEATMKRLLIYDYFRGPDSTGIAVINKTGDAVKISKMASHPLDLFEASSFKTALNGFQSGVFMGHNRAATKGVITGFNAHPYKFDHIVGCHNGTLTAASFKALEELLEEPFDVDSQAIFAAIAKVGIKETVKHLQGAWALVWYDLEEKSLNFLRNSERPFWFGYSQNFDHIFWASEWPMIDAALKLSAQPYELHTDPEHGYRFWATPENMHLKYDLATLKAGGTSKPVPVVCELKGKAPAPVVSTAAAGSDPFGRTNTGKTYGSKTTSSTTTSRSGLLDSSSNVVHLMGNKAAPFAGFISEEQFDSMAKYGCSWCSKDVAFDDPGVSVFEQDGTVLCAECSTGEVSSSRVYTNHLDHVRSAL